ncbi:hypothetical protein MTP99_010944 [Tenebrio molitor]|nr:hypothetical protein MTP99_010944 [Tenebrio molitor]
MSGNVNICEVTDDVKKALKEFRFRKAQDTAALILKVDREKQQIIIDEKLEDITIEELQENLQSHQPRYVQKSLFKEKLMFLELMKLENLKI